VQPLTQGPRTPNVGPVSENYQRVLRVFVAEVQQSEWTELTAGGQPAVRVSAPDLQQAQRARKRLRASSAAAVILDITVLLDDDFRVARRRLTELQADTGESLGYAGTLDGLAGLVADIFVAGVADGVTLIPAVPQQDARSLGEATLARVTARLQIAA
jgi:hypothetical protein